MNYLLKVIDQTKNGAEESVSYPIGDGNWRILLKTPERSQRSQNEFEEALNCYFEDVLKSPDFIKERVQGFLYTSSGATFVIYNDRVTYIVNENGKTYERIYGMYEKQ